MLEQMQANAPSSGNGRVAMQRPRLQDMNLSTGKRARLTRLLYQFGPANGTLLLLPIDQGLEHGPIDFFVNPPAQDPLFQLRLALEGGYSGIVYHIGLAEKYFADLAGRVPLVLKINGKTSIPSDAQSFSPLDADVVGAVRLGADAVGYTLYVGSPAQDRDIAQLNQVRRDCERYGMPLIVWSYPRGEAVKAKGGQDSLFAVDYAARAALELGADIIKLNIPTYENVTETQPKEYWAANFDYSYENVARKVVQSAGRAMVLFSGGSKLNDDDLMAKAHIAMQAGATGLIFGRNMWQRPYDEAIAMSRRLLDVMKDYGA